MIKTIEAIQYPPQYRQLKLYGTPNIDKCNNNKRKDQENNVIVSSSLLADDTKNSMSTTMMTAIAAMTPSNGDRCHKTKAQMNVKLINEKIRSRKFGRSHH